MRVRQAVHSGNSVLDDEQSAAMLLDNVRVFVQVARSQTFTEAARQLGMPKSTVSTRIRALENELGADLFKRTTRRMMLTEAGLRYFEATARLLSEIDVASDAVRSAGTDLTGRLRVTAGVDAGTGIVGDIVAAFTFEHPRLDVDYVLRGDAVDLVAEEVDVAIRIGKLQDSTLKARRLGMSFFKLVASPAYLQENGTPRRPSDIADHRVLCFTPKMERDIVVDLQEGSKRARVVVRRRLTSNQISAVRHQALAGCGIAYLPIGACLPELDAGRLIPVLTGWSSAGTPVQVVYPNQRFVPRKVAEFVEFAVARFGKSGFFERIRAVARG